MNYFAHGHRFIDRPYFLAGTAVPDWLAVVMRRVKARPQAARELAEALKGGDTRLAALARGIVQHHEDDARFHGTLAFTELNLAFGRQLREALPEDAGHRPGFLGHILVELLLDAELIAEEPARLEAYYAALESVDPREVARVVHRLIGRDASAVAAFIPRFLSVRFLSDYRADDTMLFRLNQVMRRVGLPRLPASLVEVFPGMRREVAQRKAELLNPTTENAS